MKIRKLIIISPLGLALLVLLVVLWWFLGNDAWVKDKLEETVSQMTGRSLSIDGAFALDWSDKLVLTAENIHLSNPSWAVNGDLAKLAHLEVSIDLFSVFKDQIQVHYIDADGLVIALEEHESGEKSWEIPSSQTAPTATPRELLAGLPITLERFTLADFTILHEAPDRNVPLDFHTDQLEVTLSADQEVQFVTDGRLGGEPFEFSGNLGSLNEFVADGRISHDVYFNLGEIILQSRGVIEQSSTFSGANIKLVFSGPRFEWLLDQLALPLFSHGDFDFRLDLQNEGELTRLDLNGDIGSLQARAKGSLDELTSTAELNAEVSGEDMGGLLEVAGVAGIPRIPFSFKVDMDHATGMFQFHTLVLESGYGSISVRGQMGDWPQLHDTDLHLLFSGADLHIWNDVLPAEILSGVSLPAIDYELSSQISRTGSQPARTDTRLRLGESRVQFTGSLGRLPSMTGADLKISADGPVDSALVQMLDIDGIPGKEFNLKATLERDVSHFYLNDASFDLSGNHLELSGRTGPGPKLEGSNLVFSLFGTELSEWSQILRVDDLPESTFSLNGEISTTAAGLVIDNLKLMLGENSLNVSGLLRIGAQQEGSNFRTRVTLPSLARIGSLVGVEGLPDSRLSVNGDYRRISDGWAFHLFNGSFATASFESEGKYTEIDGQRQIEATSRVSAPNLARLARVAGIESFPEQPLEIKGFARYEAGKVELRALEGLVGDSQFELSATWMNPPTWSEGDVTLSVSGPDFGQLLASRNTERALPFSLDGKVVRVGQEIQINQVKAQLGSMQARINGKLDDTSDADLQVAVSAPSLQPVGVLIGFSLPDEPLRLSTTLQGSPRAFRAEQLKIELGPSDLSGEVSVDLEGKPGISGVLESNYLDLAWLKDTDSGENTDEQSTDKSKQAYLIPDSPVVLPSFDFSDSEIELTINQIDFPNRTSRDIHIRSTVTDGNLYLDPFQVRGEDGGLLSGNLAVKHEDDSNITTLALSLKGDDVQLGIGSFEGQDPETIRYADVDVFLRGAGATYQDLARSLNGHVVVVQGPGLTGNAGLGLIFGNFLGEVLNLLNPSSGTEKITVNECAVTVVNIESGLLTVDPVVSQTDKMTIVAKGEVDLHTENIFFTFNTKLRKGSGISASMVVNPFVSITGTLQEPVIGLDPAAVAVTGTVAVATAGISLLAKSLADRYLSSKDPCGDALKKVPKRLEPTTNIGKSNQ